MVSLLGGSPLDVRDELHSFTGAAVMDYWLGSDRFKGDVLAMGEIGSKVRVAALSLQYFERMRVDMRPDARGLEFLASAMPMATTSVDRLEQIPARLAPLFANATRCTWTGRSILAAGPGAAGASQAASSSESTSSERSAPEICSAPEIFSQ